MLYVYDVTVYAGVGHTNRDPFVRKMIRRLRVVKTGTEYFTVSPWPEGHYLDRSEPIKVRKSDCFTDLEDAHAEANGRANELIAKLVGCIAGLKANAEVIDRTRLAETEIPND